MYVPDLRDCWRRGMHASNCPQCKVCMLEAPRPLKRILGNVRAVECPLCGFYDPGICIDRHALGWQSDRVRSGCVQGPQSRNSSRLKLRECGPCRRTLLRTAARRLTGLLIVGFIALRTSESIRWQWIWLVAPIWISACGLTFMVVAAVTIATNPGISPDPNRVALIPTDNWWTPSRASHIGEI